MASNKIKGIIVEIGGDTKKLGEALEKVNKKTKSLQTELKGVNKLLKMDPSNTTLLTQKQEILTQAIKETSDKLKALKAAQEQAHAMFEKNEITEEQYRDFQREIEATEQKLKRLTKQMEEFGSVSAQKIAAAGEKLKDMGGKVEAVGKKFSAVSTVATAGLAAVTKEAIDFETAWTGVTKTVDGTEAQMDTIKQGILDLAGVTASSAEDIAAVAENAGQLGVKTEDILSFTETMVRLGDSTNISADEAATAIAKLYNIMGGDMDTVDNFGASIVALGNNMATTESDIMNMATRIAGSGAQIGLTEQEILALAASLSSVGMEAEAGGSAISAVMTQIDKAVALDKESLATWAATAGMSVSEFKKAWETDAMSAIQAIISGMGNAKAGGENLNVLLEDLGVTSLRQTDTMKRLSGAADMMGEAVSLSNTAWKENSALTAESGKRYGTTAAKIQQLKGTLTELCVSLGDILLPIVQSVADKLKVFVNWLANLSPAAQKVVLVITALVAALAPALIIVGKVITAVGQIMTFAPQLVTVFGKIKMAISGLFSLIMAHPVIAIITAIIAAVVLLYNKCEWFRDGVNAVLAKVKEGFNALVEFFRQLPERIGAFFSNLVSRVTTWATTMWTKAKEAGRRFLENVVSFFRNLPYNVGYLLGQVIGKTARWVVDMAAKAKETGKKFLNAVVSFFKQLPGRVWSFLTNAATKTASWVVNMVAKARQMGAQFIQSVVSFFKQLPGRVWTFLSNVISRVAQWGTNLVAKGRAAAQNLVNTVVNTVKSLPSKMLSIGSDLVSGLWNGITSMGRWLKNKISSFASGIIDGFKSAFGIASPSKETAWMGEMLDEGLAAGVTKNANRPLEAMRRVTNGVLGAASTEMATRALGRRYQPAAAAPVTAGGASSDSSLLAKLDGIYERLGRLQMVTDTGTLVGEMVDRMDAALAAKQLLSARGV